MTNEVAYEKVEKYRVGGVLFTHVSSRNGMEEWRDDKGRVMIVARGYEGCFAASFKHLFGDSPLAKHEPGTLQVIACAHELAPLLREKVGLGQTQPGEAVLPG